MPDATGYVSQTTAPAPNTPAHALAFQPIIALSGRVIRGHEALLRGPSGTPAGGVLARVNSPDRAVFETAVIERILARAGALDAEMDLHVNVSPAVLLREPGVIPALVRSLQAASFPPSRLVLEVTEGEQVSDVDALRAVIARARRAGIRVALDDFGAGYNGLSMLADVLPDIIKLDMALTRGINQQRVRRSIVVGILEMARSLELEVIAEGVESVAEYRCLADIGVTLFQGFLFAPPAFERVVAREEVTMPSLAAAPAMHWLGGTVPLGEALRGG